MVVLGMSTCIRGKSGMSIRGRIITPDLLGHYMEKMGLSRHKVHALLEPDDAQNVIAAVELIQALKRIDKTLKPRNPNEKQDIKAIRAFAHLYGSFVEAFTNHTLSLSQQMRLLSTYSHLAMVMYRSDRQRFISSQLYADSQTCVKNMFFSLAKQQLLDPTKPFYLFMQGSDGVERLFAMMRMIGGHKPNVNLLELCQNLGRGMDIQHIFDKYPEWYSGHRRLSTARGDKADHLSARDWEGDVTAGCTNICRDWDGGAADAQLILHAAGFMSAECNFAEILSDPKTDILRPFGDGVYVGVPSKDGTEDEPDCSLDESVELPDADAADLVPETRSSTTREPSDEDDEDSLSADDDDDDTGSMLDGTDLSALHGLDAPPPSAEDSDDEEAISMSITEIADMAADEDGEEDSEGIDDDPTEGDEPGQGLGGDSTRKGRDDAHYVQFDGRPLHKASVIRVLINSGYTKKESRDRIRRVRTFTNASADATPSIDDTAPPDSFRAGSCFATLIRSGSDISLAIMRCTHVYRYGKLAKEPVPRADVARPEARITLQGQVLSFVELHRGLRVTRPPSSRPTDTLETLSLEDDEALCGEEMWIWDHEMVRLRPVKPSARAQDLLSLSVHGFTALPLNPPSGLVSLADDTTTPDPEDDDAHLTWSYSSVELSDLVAQLWDTLKGPETVAKLARCGASARFPYLSIKGACQLLISKHELRDDGHDRASRLQRISRRCAESRAGTAAMHVLHEVNNGDEQT
jgi:hypothetical protein